MSNEFETNILKLILQNVDAANIGDSTGLRGSSTAGSLYISLHTADPGDTDNQTTSEATYGSYARVAVARSAGAWTVTNDAGTNASTITFPTATSGTNSITHFGIGTASSGAGHMLLTGALTSTLSVSTGVAPNFPSSTLTVTAA